MKNLIFGGIVVLLLCVIGYMAYKGQQSKASAEQSQVVQPGYRLDTAHLVKEWVNPESRAIHKSVLVRLIRDSASARDTFWFVPQLVKDSSIGAKIKRHYFPIDKALIVENDKPLKLPL